METSSCSRITPSYESITTASIEGCTEMWGTDHWQYIYPEIPFLGGGVMVWVGICLGWFTELHKYCGRFTGQFCRDENIFEYNTNRRLPCTPKLYIFYDCSPLTQTRVFLQCLNEVCVTHVALSPIFSDFYPIKHAWYIHQTTRYPKIR